MRPKGQTSGSGISQDGQRVGRQAALMSLGTLSSRVLGLLRESLLAAYFDRSITDAWVAAFRLPNLFRRLFGEGSLSVSFIPVFVETRTKHPDLVSGAPSPEVKNLVNGFYTLLLLGLSVLTVFGTVFPEALLHLILDQSFLQDPSRFETTRRLAQIMFSFVFFIVNYAFFMGILNSLGRFGWAAMTPLFFNLALILSTLWPQEHLHYPGEALAWGVVIGGILQAGLLIPQMRRLKYVPSLQWRIFTPENLKILRGLGPGLLGLGLMQITLVFNTRFASSLGEGSISYIHWADRLLELPLSLISVSLGTALLPTLATAWSKDQRLDFSRTGSFYLRLNFYLSMACAVGLGVLARPIVEILFERGLFTEQDTSLAAEVLQIYALSMIPTSGVRILAPMHFAVKNTWWPAVVSLLSLSVHLILAPELMQRWGLRGLNISSLVSASLSFFLLLGFLQKFTTQFEYLKFSLQICKFLVCCGSLALGLWTYYAWPPALVDSHLMIQICCFVLSSAFGGLLFAVTSSFLKLEEFDVIWKKIASRLQR